jgi:hypothetical protein
MKAYGKVEVYIHIFLTSALAGGEWSVSCSSGFAPGTHWRGSSVDPRAGLDDVEKKKFLNLPGLELRPLVRPARIIEKTQHPYCWSRHCIEKTASSFFA